MSKLLKKYWPLFGLMLILLIIAYYLFDARNRGIKEAIVSQLLPEEGLKLRNIHYIQHNPDEGLKWMLDAREVTFSKDQNHIFFKEFHLRLEPENRSPVDLLGQEGDYIKSLDEIQLRGKIRGVWEDGYRIDTEQLRYQQRMGTLESDDYVLISGPFFSVRGKGLHLDLEERKLKILSEVNTLIDQMSLKL